VDQLRKTSIVQGSTQFTAKDISTLEKKTPQSFPSKVWLFAILVI
jgi:hypothetical protein